MAQDEGRAQWGSRLGFVLAAAGSAVGLGNLWKFPYITGENGGGAFVLIYLLFIGLIGLPIMTAEVALGKMTQKSPVGAFRKLGGDGSPWTGVGWLGVATGFLILSYYSVVAGWALHYLMLSLKGTFAAGADPEQVKALFGGMASSGTTNLAWHSVFMAATILVVVLGVQQGVERAAKVLMPTLFVMLIALVIYGATLPGFGQALDFVFGFHTDKLTGRGVLEALGHSFFTLSLGMGAMLTYGSYMKRDQDVVNSSIAISLLDTAVALMACLALFPITFSGGMTPTGGPGLVFTNMPLAFSQLPGGTAWATLFFLLLAFAALTSSISLLEVCASYFIDELGWDRKFAVPLLGAIIWIVGVPTALSFGDGAFGAQMAESTGRTWFDHLDYLTSNWALPLGGLGISLFMAWKVGDAAREQALAEGSRIGSARGFYLAWLQLLRFLVPIGIVLAMLNALGVFAPAEDEAPAEEAAETEGADTEGAGDGTAGTTGE